MDSDWQHEIDEMKQNLTDYRNKFWQLFLYWSDEKCPNQALDCFNLSDLLDMIYESLNKVKEPFDTIEEYKSYKYGEFKHVPAGFTRGSVGLLDGFDELIHGSTLDDNLESH